MEDAIASVTALLKQTGIPFALIGGHAVNAWLEPRFTADIDIAIQADRLETERLIKSLIDADYAVQKEYGADLPSGPDFIRLISADEEITVEVQASKTEFQDQMIARAQASNDTAVATPEDLIVMKLIAGRPKDQIDLLGLVDLPNLDWDYVERWVAEWGLTEDLRRICDRAG